MMGGGEESILDTGASDESRLASSWHHVADNNLYEEPRSPTPKPLSTEAPLPIPVRMHDPTPPTAVRLHDPTAPIPVRMHDPMAPIPVRMHDPTAQTTSGTTDVRSIVSAVSDYREGNTEALEDLGLEVLPGTGSILRVRLKEKEKLQEDEPADNHTGMVGGEAPAREAAAKLSLERSKARLTKKAADLASLRKTIRAYVPGTNLLPAGDKTTDDYVIPRKTVLLLVGDMGAGKSTLVNNIHRAVHNTRADLDIAATASSPTGSHSLLLQEYTITPRVLVFDTRGLSVGNTWENVGLLKDWVKHGVAHSQAVIRSSDAQVSREAIQDRVRRHGGAFRKRQVNFAIYVVNAAAIDALRRRSNEERRAEAQRMRSIYGALHHFKDYSPIVVMTHGDQLSPEDRDRARVYIAETLGVDPGEAVFDIASFTGREQEDEESDPAVDAAILTMLQQALKLADRSMPPVDQTGPWALASLAPLFVAVGLYVAFSVNGVLFLPFLVLAVIVVIAAVCWGEGARRPDS